MYNEIKLIINIMSYYLFTKALYNIWHFTLYKNTKRLGWKVRLNQKGTIQHALNCINQKIV